MEGRKQKAESRKQKLRWPALGTSSEVRVSFSRFSLPTAHSPLPTAHCRLPTAYCLLPTAYCTSTTGPLRAGRKATARSRPIINPPTWAHQATPPPVAD